MSKDEVKLDTRDVKNLEKYLAVTRSQDATEEEKDDAYGKLAGYVNSAIHNPAKRGS